MKKMKKLFAVILSLAMVLAMSLTAFAEDHKPVPTDKATITVNGIKAGATVKAFKVAEGEWNAQGFTGYKALEIDGIKIADLTKPTAEEITDLAKKVDKTGGTTLSDADKKGIYTAELEVGSYLILVTANAADDMTAYNPMIASVYYSTEKSGNLNDQIGGMVDASQDFVVDGQKLFAKSMNPGITKEILSPREEDDNKYGNDTAIGTAITFEVKTAFPAYSDEYTNVEFNIVDTLSEGLTLALDTVEVVSVGMDEPTKGVDYNVTQNGQTMTISFTSEYILAHRGDEVTVHYDAALNENAGINFDKNTNTVKAEYTNNPDTNSKGTTEEKETYHYTFGIDAAINGKDSEVTKELYKVHGEEGKVEVLEVETDTVEVTNPLEGAVFELRTQDGKVVKTATSAKDGSLTFTGLDAGTYKLVETAAPAGYSLDATEHTVEITAVYNKTDGTLASYTITIDGTATSTYNATYDGEKKVTEVDYTEVGSVGIKNLKLSALPSTGGIGTTIFTIGGCAIMIVAAGLFFASRRKSAK
ncbi:SpaA isopeptide-forming pilin-related protein [Lachnospiraceae bacterium 62-26]